MSSDKDYLSFFFNDTATTEIYTLSLHDALPISGDVRDDARADPRGGGLRALLHGPALPRLHLHHPARARRGGRSEEHTSELQSRQYLVCRLLLEKKKQIITIHACSSSPVLCCA